MTAKTIDIDVYFAELEGREIAYGLSEAEVRKLAEGPSVRIFKRRLAVFPVAAAFRGAEGETCHVGWQCPTCSQAYSDDVSHDASGPLLACCGRTRCHADSNDTWVMLDW